MVAPEGRLELTWTNKHLRLLAHENDSYEWVPAGDYRVAEVRLLHEVAVVGEVGRRRAADNLLIRGDALHALQALARLPEFAREYLGKVRLAYLDPPFNTGQAFEHYDDNLEHSVWLTILRDRLEQIRTLLAPNGSVWVHLDDQEAHRARLVLDEVFGIDCFAAEIVWRASDNSNNDAQQFSDDHNTLLVYTASPAWRSNRESGSGRDAHYKNPTNDPRGAYFDGNPLNSPNPRDNLRYDLVAPNGNVIPHPPNGWRWSEDTIAAKIETGEIRWRADYTGIYRRTYLADHAGLPPSNLWTDLDQTGHNRQAKYELRDLFPGVPTSQLFSTPKPERLLKRIMSVATDPGDIVLDCFGGSGTTAAVAHKLGRRWVLTEWSPDVIARFTLPRLTKVIVGKDSGGVSTVEVLVGEELPEGVKLGQARTAAKVLSSFQAAGLSDEIPGLTDAMLKGIVKALRDAEKVTTEVLWEGGGGFRVLDIAPSMFVTDEGMVFLAEGMINGQLAEATAAQLGFEFGLSPPFAGKKGRTRLAVIDGIVTEAVVRLLANALGERERVVVCGTAIDPDARPILRELRPGSTLRKIPAALIDEYRVGGRLRRRLDELEAEQESESAGG